MHRLSARYLAAFGHYTKSYRVVASSSIGIIISMTFPGPSTDGVLLQSMLGFLL